jgi:hypothetical protein
MKHYLWAVINFNSDTGVTSVNWAVTTDPLPAHHIFQQWVRIAEFVWGGK